MGLLSCLLVLSTQAMHENKVLQRTSISIKRMDSGNFKAQMVYTMQCVARHISTAQFVTHCAWDIQAHTHTHT